MQQVDKIIGNNHNCWFDWQRQSCSFFVCVPSKGSRGREKLGTGFGNWNQFQQLAKTKKITSIKTVGFSDPSGRGVSRKIGRRGKNEFGRPPPPPENLVLSWVWPFAPPQLRNCLTVIVISYIMKVRRSREKFLRGKLQKKIRGGGAHFQ